MREITKAVIKLKVGSLIPDPYEYILGTYE